MAQIKNEKVRVAYANFRSSKRKQMETYLSRMHLTEEQLKEKEWTMPKIFGYVFNPDTDEIEECLRIKSGQYGIADVFMNGRTREEILNEMISQTYHKNNPDFFLKEFLCVYLDNKLNLNAENQSTAKRLSKTRLRRNLNSWVDGKEAPEYLTQFLGSES